MPEPRFKSPIDWEPLSYLVLFVLVVVAGSIRPDVAPIPFWIATALAVAAAVFFVISLVRDVARNRANPDGWGNLKTLDGLSIVAAEHRDAETRPYIAVADVHRHQSAIDIARARSGDHLRAVLVPRASRWLSNRYRIGVQLVAGDRIAHAGFLPDVADRRWREELGALRDAGAFVSVPARIRGTEKPFTVELDASGLAEALAARGVVG
ncbi:MAG: hypothetical protein ABWY36_00445 [Leifsonia sp.]